MRAVSARGNGQRMRAAALMVFAGAVVAAGARQTASRSARDGVYTTAQATRGTALYGKQCAECHGAIDTVFPEVAPLLADHVFKGSWKNRSVGELFERIRDTMPQNKPRTLSPEQTADLIAAILSANRLPAGETPLAQDVDLLKQIRMDTEQ